MSPRHALRRTDAGNLADVLERVLDKGIVIAGDITVRLVDVELLTIQVRLVITSVDKARELGIDWWSRDLDRMLTERGDRPAELAELKRRIAELERAELQANQDRARLAPLLPRRPGT